MKAVLPSIVSDPPSPLRTEIAVVGSGPGGSITACLLAEAGRDVLLIEEGSYLSLESCRPFTQQEMLQKYRNGGITAALGRSKVAYVEGRCVGGGSEVNSGLYHRTPPDVLDEWRRDYQVEALSERDLHPHFEACERETSVSYLPGPAPMASLKLHDGATRLGWQSMEAPRWFRYPAADGAAVVEGKRQSMTETFVPRMLAAGGRLLPAVRVERLIRHRDGWLLRAAHGAGRTLRPLRIEADRVFVCCGAIQTAALLRRSGITANVGDTLHMHPTVKVVARFEDEINSESMGVPVHQVKQFAPRFSFGCSISSPPYQALALQAHPETLSEVGRHWKRMGIYYAMIRGGCGTVRPLPFFRDPLVRYQLAPANRVELADGLRELCRCLLAAGATALYPAIPGSARLSDAADLGLLPSTLPVETSLMTIHLFSTCPMGEDRKRCAVDSFGRVHGFRGLHVADASLLCGAPGVNPQGSIMAFVRRNALHFLGRL